MKWAAIAPAGSTGEAGSPDGGGGLAGGGVDAALARRAPRLLPG